MDLSSSGPLCWTGIQTPIGVIVRLNSTRVDEEDAAWRVSTLVQTRCIKL